MSNITLLENAFTGSAILGVFYLNTFDHGIISVDGFHIIDTDLGQKNALHYTPSGSGNLFINKVTADNVTIDDRASILKTESMTNLAINNCELTGVEQSNLKDDTSMIFNIGTLNVQDSSIFSIVNVSVTASTVPLFEINRIQNQYNVSQAIAISGISYSDSVLEYKQNLIVFGRIESSTNVQLIMNDINMHNITFRTTGVLIKFQHQTSLPLSIQN